MRVQAAADCAVPADALTYWIAPAPKTPVKIDQSMASAPPFIERELRLLSCQPRLPPPTSVHLALLILMQTKDNYQLRFTCAVDLTCKGLLSSLNEYIAVFFGEKRYGKEKCRWGFGVSFVELCLYARAAL